MYLLYYYTLLKDILPTNTFVSYENLRRRHHLIIKYKFTVLLATKLKAGQK